MTSLGLTAGLFQCLIKIVLCVSDTATHQRQVGQIVQSRGSSPRVAGPDCGLPGAFRLTNAKVEVSKETRDSGALNGDESLQP